jgi:prepilin signal peptidase PulO-like enzyme (type II secretory pathway)
MSDDVFQLFCRHKTAVFVNVTLFFLLYSHALCVIYILNELYSLFLVELFTSVCWCLWLILVLGYIRLKTLKELKKAYSNALVI